MNKKQLKEKCDQLGIAYNNSHTVKQLKQMIHDFNNQEINKVEEIIPLQKHEEVKPIISKISARQFCMSKNIIGFYKEFLIKKYGHELLTKNQWTEILIKEKINNL